jgi:tetratricopeptide repeat protein 30
VGTLYCSKQNFEFGISRIIVSFSHFHKRMNMDTWFYAKRCFLSLIENLAKQILVLADNSYMEIIKFLDQADVYGKNISTQVAEQHKEENHEKFTVSSEARLLKKMFLKLRTYYESSK